MLMYPDVMITMHTCTNKPELHDWYDSRDHEMREVGNERLIGEVCGDLAMTV